MHAYRLDQDDSDEELSRAPSVDDHQSARATSRGQKKMYTKQRGKKTPSQKNDRPRQSVFDPSRLEYTSGNGYEHDVGDSSSGEEENYINGKRQCILGIRKRMVREDSIADSSIRTTQSSISSIPKEHHGNATVNNMMRMSNQHLKTQSSTTKKNRMSVEGNKRKPGGVMQLEFKSRSSKSRGVEEDSQDSFF